MKILIINTVVFKLNGITSVIMNYFRKMDKKDIDIHFMTINEITDEYKNEIESFGSKVYYIERKKNPIKYIFDLKKLLKENCYDIVHIHGNSATMALETMAAYLARVPVRIIHSHNTTCKYRVIHNILYPMLRKTYTHGFACGNEAGKWLFKKNKYEIIKNGIDLEEFKYNEKERKKYREKINAGNKTILGHIGNFVYQKNHDFLIDLFNELLKSDKDYLLLLIGEGELEEVIKEKVKRLGIEDNVIFIGKSMEVKGYLQAIDLFLLPSHFEGLPVVLIEAQAMGIPCLVSDKVSNEASITSLVKFISIDDVELWKRNIKKQNNKTRELNSNLAHKNINNAGYNISKNAEKMRLLYESYVNEKNNK